MLDHIKRDKNENVKIYESNEELIHTDADLMLCTGDSVINSKLYLDVPVIEEVKDKKFNLSVVNSSSLVEAMKFENAVILNFASAIHPGGGYIRGSNAQEECLCRSSNLYNILQCFPEHYKKHVDMEDVRYTDDMIYSPNVCFFRDDYGYTMPKKYFNIITAALPYNKAYGVDLKQVRTIAERRIEKVLRIAQANGDKNLILGAWGCGAFYNDPGVVSKAFNDVLKKNIWNFDNVVFAVLDNQDESLVNTFRKNLE